MKKFIITHPHHTLLYMIGGGMLSLIAVCGVLIWNSSSRIYAEQSSANSGAYVAGVSQALAGATAGSAGAAAQSQSSRKATAPATPAQSTASTQPSQQAQNSQPAQSQPVVAAQTVAANTASKGVKLYVDPARAGLPAPLNSSAVATWLGGWNPDVAAAANTVVTNAVNSGSVATLVAYNIPGRDCGSYSAGGANGSDAYKSWIRSVAAGIGARQAIVILEPDALAQITCLDNAGQAARYALLQDAVTVLATQTRASVYIDAGNPTWINATEMANRLTKAGIAQATGFSLNVSNFETTANNTSYGNTISSKTGGKHFVIDTGRNGNGPGNTWCNPSGRALGETPTTSVGGNVDAYLWVKVPGESDGTCNGGPSAGTYWADYAQALIANRH